MSDNDLRLLALRTGFAVSGKDGYGMVCFPVEAIKYLTDQEIGMRVRVLFQDCLPDAGDDRNEESVARAENTRLLPNVEWEAADKGAQILLRIAKEHGPREAAKVMAALDELAVLSAQEWERQQ